MAIVNVYIDGFDLRYGALKRTPYKWLDFRSLPGRVLSPSPQVGRQDIANPRCRLRHLLFYNRYKNSYSDEKKASR